MAFSTDEYNYSSFSEVSSFRSAEKLAHDLQKF